MPAQTRGQSKNFLLKYANFLDLGDQTAETVAHSFGDSALDGCSCFSLGVARQVLQDIGVESAAIRVLRPALPHLGNHIQIAIAVQVSDENIMPANSLVQNDAFLESHSTEMLKDKPAARVHAFRGNGRIFLLHREDVQVPIEVEIRNSQGMKRTSGPRGRVWDLVRGETR